MCLTTVYYEFSCSLFTLQKQCLTSVRTSYMSPQYIPLVASCMVPNRCVLPIFSTAPGWSHLCQLSSHNNATLKPSLGRFHEAGFILSAFLCFFHPHLKPLTEMQNPLIESTSAMDETYSSTTLHRVKNTK